MKERKQKVFNITVKLNIVQSEDVKKIIEDKDLKYRSASDFVTKAVDRELQIAGLKTTFSPVGIVHFDLLYNVKLNEAYEEALRGEAARNGVIYPEDAMASKPSKELVPDRSN
jgi:hypothetical protein